MKISNILVLFVIDFGYISQIFVLQLPSKNGPSTPCHPVKHDCSPLIKLKCPSPFVFF